MPGDSSIQLQGPDFRTSAAAAPRPNIIDILLDDATPSVHVHALGAADADTPRMDQLVASGVKLSSYHVTSSICTPSRYSHLTGRYAGRNLRNRRHTPLDEPIAVDFEAKFQEQADGRELTICHELDAIGYQTGYFGKYHNVDKWAYQQWKLGYEDFVPHSDINVNSAAGRAQLAAEGEWLQATVLNATGCGVAARLYHGNVDKTHNERVPPALAFHNPEWVIDGALRFLHAASTSTPVYMHVALTIPHGPSNTESLAKHDGLLITPLGLLDPADAPSHVISLDRSTILSRASTAPRATERRARAEALWIDECVGALLDGLAERNQSSTSLVWLASDHSGRKMMKGKGQVYDSGSRTMGILSWPSVVASSQSTHALASNIDLLPTFVEAAMGNRHSQPQRAGRIDGLSLWGLATGETSMAWRAAMLLEVGYVRAVVTRRHKYVATRCPSAHANCRVTHNYGPPASDPQWDTFEAMHPSLHDADELFDLIADAAERHSLLRNLTRAGNWTDECVGDLTVEMRHLLRGLLHGREHPFGEF